MTAEVIKEPCLVRIGRTGTKTHRGSVEYTVESAGKPWSRKRIRLVHCHCVVVRGVGRMYNRGLTPFLGTSPDDATCEKCRTKV